MNENFFIKTIKKNSYNSNNTPIIDTSNYSNSTIPENTNTIETTAMNLYVTDQINSNSNYETYNNANKYNINELIEEYNTFETYHAGMYETIYNNYSAKVNTYINDIATYAPNLISPAQAQQMSFKEKEDYFLEHCEDAKDYQGKREEIDRVIKETFGYLGINTFEEYKNTEFFEKIKKHLKEIKNLDKNVDYSDKDKIYKVKYKMNGEEECFYITPKKIDGLNTFKLNIEEYIMNNGLFSGEDFEIIESELPELTVNNFAKLKGYSNLFNEETYGGYQGDVREIIKAYYNPEKELTTIEKKKAELMISLIKKNFPDMSETDIINLACKYSAHGCNYISDANAFLVYMGGIENGPEIFKEKIGFDYQEIDEISGEKSCNIEALVLDMYLRVVKKNSNGDISKFLKKDNGINDENYEEYIVEYFREHGINMEFKITEHAGVKDNIINSILVGIANDPDAFYVLNSNRFSLKELDYNNDLSDANDSALASATTSGKKRTGVGGHAMLITEIDENNNIIVSSWSGKYEYIPEFEPSSTGSKIPIIGPVIGTLELSCIGGGYLTSIHFNLDE